jgi:hypothetical protein
MHTTIQFPTAGYDATARQFNQAVRQRGYGVTIAGREWLSFGRKFVTVRINGRVRRLTYPQYNAGQF